MAANYYSEIPKKIRNKEMTKAIQVGRFLKQIYPNDKEFEDSFISKSISDSNLARYLLMELENFVSTGNKLVDTDPNKVNLEHIAPKQSNQHWNEKITSIPDDQRADYINKIGNIALVSKANNKRVGAKDFETKKAQLFSIQDDFILTKNICEYDIWDKKSIEDRQSKLAKLAVKVWCIKFD